MSDRTLLMPESASDLTPGDIDLLMLNLEASRHVHTRAHFYSWTQGLLQGLIHHEALVCTLRTGAACGVVVEALSTRLPDSSVLSAPLVSDIALVPRLVDAWKARHYLPFVLPARCVAGSGRGELAFELDHIGASQLALHGCHDSQGDATSFFVFACQEGVLAARELGLLGLIGPFLHEAWVRVLMNTACAGRRDAAASPAGHAVITLREREILRWIYLGKSNSEIGQILSISPLTVKNHVQKVLHKLDVVNRAQAVGKALAAHLIHE